MRNDCRGLLDIGDGTNGIDGGETGCSEGEKDIGDPLRVATEDVAWIFQELHMWQGSLTRPTTNGKGIERKGQGLYLVGLV